MSSPAQPGEKDFYQEFFANLERQLAAVSHTDEAALIVESAVAERFKKTAQRQIAFAQPNIICVEPISYSGALASGAIKADEDQFTMLQGDIVSTEAAYLMGERIVGSSMFAVLNSTCDLVPGRREYASLLRVFPVTGDGDALKSALHHLLSSAAAETCIFRLCQTKMCQRSGIQSDSTAWRRSEWRICSSRSGSVRCRSLGGVFSARLRGS